MSDNFKITYEVQDGYVGASRPQHTSISASELNGDESEEELKAMFWDEIQRDFQEKCTAYSRQQDEFVEWAKSKQSEISAE